MIEGGQDQADSGPAPIESTPLPLTAGGLLRQAREAAGLHVGALAVALKVPVRKLEALEADRYDLLTDAVFVRALASSMCRSLKVDPQPILDRLPAMAAPRLMATTESLNAPFRAPGDGAPPTWLDQLSRPVFLAVFALLLGALVLILLPRAQAPDAAASANPGAARAPDISAAQPSTSVPAAPEAVTTVISPAMAVEAASAPIAVPVSAAVAATGAAPLSAASASKAAASSPAAAAAPPVVAKPAADAPATPASGLIVFRAKAESWVEVVDAKDNVAVRKVLQAGESAAASGALPLRVIIGRVDATQVQVRGKPFDLRPVSSDNVARFEVK